ncbi:MAG: hypothetical protein KBC27_00630 [Rickettsiales bacterium]|nr:hypothetical protein [Rickettsiales bacterium]
MPTSLVELIKENWEAPEGVPLEPSETEVESIGAFEKNISSLSDADREIIADVIALHVGRDTITSDPESIRGLMTFSNILNARFNDDQETLEGLNLQQLDHHLENTDFSTKLLVAEMFAKEMQGESNLEQLVSDLNEELAARTTPEAKYEFLVAQDKLLSQNLEKVAMETESAPEIEVRRSAGSFLADQVFIPSLHKSAKRELSDAQSEGANVAAERQPIGVAEARKMPEMMTSFHEFVSDDRQRELLEREVVKAIQGLEEVVPEAGKYLMSVDKHDSVDVQEVDGGKYTVVPGKNFTGIIQINRQVPEGEEESFDVLEFKNGVLVSGVEGARGVSQISNMEELLGTMVSESQEPPFFVFNSADNRSRVSEKVADIREVFGVAEDVKEMGHLDLARYKHKKFPDALKAIVSDNIQAIQKKGVWGYSVPLVHSGQYDTEQKVAVDQITVSLMDEFSTKGISESALERHRDKILNAVYDAVLKKNGNVQEVLSAPESLGNPEHVRSRLDELGIGKAVADSVWKECKEELAREALREAMLAQIKERIPPEASSYKIYTEYRDKLVEHIVDKAMENLPKDLTAEQIKKNHDMFLKEFDKASKTQDVPLRAFLQAHRDKWFGQSADVDDAKGFKEVPIAEKVAQDSMKFESTEEKEGAVDNVMDDIRGMLKDSQQGGVKAATWFTREWHDKQRDAVVEKMLEEIKVRLMRDPKITTEMLYNNREALVEVVKDQVQVNKDAVKYFLDKKENQDQDFEAIKDRWSSECAGVTSNFVKKISEKLEENVDIESERAVLLSEFRQQMEQHVKETVSAVKKTGVGALVGSGEYHFERDVMAAEIADQACKALEDRDLSYGALRRDRESIMQSFEHSLQEHAKGIATKLEQIVEVGATGKKTEAAIRERKGEVTDVNVADYIADGFSRSVAAVMEVQKAVGLRRSLSVSMPSVPQTARFTDEHKQRTRSSGAQTAR